MDDSAPPFTAAHPACARVLSLQLEVARKMRRLRQRLIDSPERPYTGAANTDIRRLFDQVRGGAE